MSPLNEDERNIHLNYSYFASKQSASREIRLGTVPVLARRAYKFLLSYTPTRIHKMSSLLKVRHEFIEVAECRIHHERSSLLGATRLRRMLEDEEVTVPMLLSVQIAVQIADIAPDGHVGLRDRARACHVRARDGDVAHVSHPVWSAV